MELPSEVMIHNALLGLKGTKGRLLQISPEGYYEVNCVFGDSTHRLMLPIAQTVIIAGEAEEAAGPQLEVER